MIKKILLNLLIICVGLLVGYKSGLNKANKINEDYKKTIINETLENYSIPECDYIGGGCPEYKMFDVDEDGRSESIVLEKVGMSQFGGRVFVIDEGKVTFVSESQMFIGVRPIKLEENDETNRNGFIIFYSKVPNANSKNDIEWAWYKYENGEYILDKITSAGEE